MPSSWRLYGVLLACCVVGTIGSVAVVDSATGALSQSSDAIALASNFLAVPGVQELDGAQQLSDEAAADRLAPAALAAAQRSLTAYRHLDAGAAMRVARELMPAVVSIAPTGPARMPHGARIGRYLNADSVQISLPGARHVVAVSTNPIATRDRSGVYRPLDLRLRRSGRVFAAAMPAAPVSIPVQVADGIRLASSGVSLTPLGNSGMPLRAAGSLDGGAVLYPNTQTDTDTAAKPIPAGLETYTLLRSPASPEHLSFRLWLPSGARVLPVAHDPGAERVVEHGRTLATIPPPVAQDAAGTPVPVHTTLSGDTIRLDVPHRGRRFRYPITVDPTMIDANFKSANWRFEGGHPSGDIGEIEFYEYDWAMVAGWYQENDWGALLYPTQGESHIYEMSMETASSLDAGLESHLVILGPSGWEGSTALSISHSRELATVCISGKSCSSSEGTAGNVAGYWMNAIAEGTNDEPKTTTIYAASVYVAQNNGPTASFDTTKEKVASGTKNVLSPSGGWISPSGGAAEVDYSDPGVGVHEILYTAGAVKWTKAAGGRSSACAGLQCAETGTQEVDYSDSHSGTALPDGEPTLEAKVVNGMGSSYAVSTKVKVDGTAPHELSLSGLPGSGELTDSTRNLKLTAHATDGVTGTPSSGVASLKLMVDGSEVGAPNGSCSPGPCTATGEWMINGEDFSTGKHTVTITAIDAAGNSTTSEMGSFTVHHAAPVSIGPGSFNPVTGEFDLEAEDVSVAAPGTPLTINRSYNSREPSAGSSEAFGAPWTMSFGGAEKLVKGYQGNMTLTAMDGSQTTFVSRGGGSFESPPGDKTIVLTGSKSETEFTLGDDGAATKFTHVTGDAENVYRASFATGTSGTHTTQFTYQSVGGVLEPLQELAPVPVGISCSPSLKPGCRALTYNFATTTTATGESSSQWGDYAGRLTRVYFSRAAENEKGELLPLSTEIAHYLYDSKGRLRAEWDPRISPALKTTYGYDSEGHLTTVTPPGKESWAFTYGTTSNDTSPGRLLKVYRPPASESLWGGEGPKNTAAPKLTGSALIGVPMSTSDGAWSGTPITYGYQWERCNSAGGECQAIGGATNAVYTPASSDAGHTLLAQVTADNGGGAVTADTSASVVVSSSTGWNHLQSIDGGNSLNGVACVPGTTDCVVSDSKGNALYSTNVSSSSSSTWTSWTGPGVSPGTALSCPTSSLCLMVDGIQKAGGKLYATTSLGGTWTGPVSSLAGFKAVACPSSSFCVITQEAGFIRYSTTPTTTSSWTSEKVGSAMVTSVSCLSSSFCLVGDGAGKVHVATSTTQIESPSWTETTVDGTTTLNGVACTSTTSCVAVDPAGNVLDLTIGSGGEASASKQNIDGSNSLTAVACTSTTCVTVDDHGYAFVSHDSGKTWTVLYHAEAGLTSVSCASATLCVTVDTLGEEIALNPEASGSELRSPQPGSVIEYGVPVSGTGAPYAMSSGEVAKWAQTDVPVEATAVFSIDEPQGWPATDYRRATIDYLDANDRLVNVAEPGGAIVTSEYNSYNDVVRNLSADNRAAALKEGAKSAEVSQTLDTQSTYGAEGAELLSVLGPLHTVKLASGYYSVQARKHTVYSYDEGAPATGGPYRLVTKVTEGAQITGEPEADIRTTTTSYSGQNNLGWALRKPTAKRVDPSGLKLVYSTVYDPATGNVTETRTPAAGTPSEELLSGYVYRSSYGGSGSGNGQLSKPAAITKDAEGNLWVADTSNNRVEEFSSGGTYIRQFGTVGEGNGQFKGPKGIAIDGEGRVWVTDTGNNRVQVFSNTGTYLLQFGISGVLESTPSVVYFKEPTGIVYSPEEKRMFVADTGNNRVQEFFTNTEYTLYSATFGSKGSGNGQLSKPEGITVDSASPNHIWVADTGNNRVEEFSSGGYYTSQFGTAGTGNGQFKSPQGIAIDSEGNVLVADGGNNRVQEFSASGTYQFQFGTAGTGETQMKTPAALILDSANDAYVLDTGNSRIEKWQPAGSYHESSGSGGMHGKQTIYYSAAENTEVPTCGKHAEWAGLPCETRPAAQPETSGVPNLPVTTVTYNEWDELEETKETVGSNTRTTYNGYYAGARMSSQHVTSSVGTTLPVEEYQYDSKTGELTGESQSTGPIELVHNTLGQLTSYKDSDGSTSTYSYDAFGRLEAVNDGKGTQTYTYDATTGLPIKLVDSAAGTFTASYDVEGNLTTVGYPNGMNVNHTYDATGSETGVEYLKTTHCTSGCVWYSQSESPSIHGQTLSQASTLSSQTYTYDAAGRLTKTQDTPTGEGCTTRIYAFDEETNITSLTTRAPGGEGKCATEGGTAVNHTYDPANRLMDTGTAYDAFGDITKLPAGDAGGSELTSTYYVDGTLATQIQGAQTIGYNLDPDGRDRQIVSTGTVNSTVTYHYAGSGSAPSWTEDTGGKWTRNIYGPEGLTAVQTGGESPVLQIQDLKGNIVGTASLSETATGLLSKGDSTEYGVPRTSSPPKYSWQGASALRTELPSGVVAMGARSYVPEVGRFLQPDPIEGGSANAYAYTYGDPVNSSDPSGEFAVGTPSWVSGFLDEQSEAATEAAIQRAAEEQAAREEAEEKAREAAEGAVAEAAEAATEATVKSNRRNRKGKTRKRGGATATASYVCAGDQTCNPEEPKGGRGGGGGGRTRPKKCLPGEVRVGNHCEKGPGPRHRPEPPKHSPPGSPIVPLPPIVGEGMEDCVESGLCAI